MKCGESMECREDLNNFIREKRKASLSDKGLLAGVRIIDLSTVLAAPYAATLLGDYGAEVIKVENPGFPDSIRSWGVVENDVSPFWAVFGRNKYPITVDLKNPRGIDILRRLIKESDVIVENMRPGTMERLGLDMDSLLSLNPGLVIGRISGYGQHGPYAKRAGFGTLAEGLSGFTYVNAQPQGIPTNPPLALADFIAGMHLAMAIMICLRKQERGKRGGMVIDISLYEPLFSLFGPAFLTYCLNGECAEPQGNELSYVAPRNNYQTKDGRWITLSASAQKPFERMMDAIGRPDMKTDPRFKANEKRTKPENRQILNRVLSEWFGSKTLEEGLAMCDRLGITAGPIASMKDIAENPHYKERGSWAEVEDPITKRLFKMPNVPVRFVTNGGKIEFPGLPHGSANEVILEDLLSYSKEEVRKLKDEKVI